ncbi:MAG: hypothetical protein J6Q61_01060 [Bacteroidales bacterium]|nr:hypothetical protein [Bacteroidales bacterium]
MRKSDQALKFYQGKIESFDYTFCHYKKFDYTILKYIPYKHFFRGKEKISYNDIIIMADTETSKKQPDKKIIKNNEVTWETDRNHVVAWTISLRAFGHNIATLYGRKPSTMIDCLMRIHGAMAGAKTFIYFHNLSYDYVFLRQFMFKAWGYPEKALNVKTHYPIYISFSNGIILKDSLILAQRKLEKWADDLKVEHRKEVGSWDYDKIRNQDTELSDLEKSYIEHDTLAGVECLDVTLKVLNKNISSIPLTATGVPREKTRRAGKRRAHDEFCKMCLTLPQYLKALKLFHGGYTHGNRHYVNQLIDVKLMQDIMKAVSFLVKCYDIASSYPFNMCAYKMPMERFTPMKNCKKEFILENMEDYAYMFKLTAVNIRLKSDSEPMPALQFSKCVKTINAIQDNGRILAANYVEIYLNEYDLAVIDEQYEMDKHICTEVESAYKDYLPRWFTDFIFQCFYDKTMLKGGDAVLYAISKQVANCNYGMTVQKSIMADIVENYETGEYKEIEKADQEAAYQEYLSKVTTILPYQWGVWVTSIGFYRVHQLMKCCKHPLYGDTDSCYGVDWDLDKLQAYNDEAKRRLKANQYGPVVKNGREYWLGVAEHDPDEDDYIEFKFMGAKRYCGRNAHTGKIKITVAGVPKKKGAECLEDDIENFTPGFVFSGEKTGKKTHVYFYNDIYTDEAGNETGDSISLTPCDYKLDSIKVYDWEKLFNREVNIQIYDDV